MSLEPDIATAPWSAELNAAFRSAMAQARGDDAAAGEAAWEAEEQRRAYWAALDGDDFARAARIKAMGGPA